MLTEGFVSFISLLTHKQGETVLAEVIQGHRRLSFCHWSFVCQEEVKNSLKLYSKISRKCVWGIFGLTELPWECHFSSLDVNSVGKWFSKCVDVVIPSCVYVRNEYQHPANFTVLQYFALNFHFWWKSKASVALPCFGFKPLVVGIYQICYSWVAQFWVLSWYLLW